MSRVVIGCSSVVLSLLVALLAIASPAQSAPATAGDRLEWVIRPVTPPGITANTIPMMEFSSLQNVLLGRYLMTQNSSMTGDASVTLVEHEVKHFRFEPSGSWSRPLSYWLVVAIRSRSGLYLKAAPPGGPAAVVLSPTPAFEWVIRGGQNGRPVPFGALVSIHNLWRTDQLVSCPNAPGEFKLGWAAQCGAWAAGEQPVPPAPPRPVPSLPSGALQAETPPVTPFHPSVHPGAVQWGVAYGYLGNNVTSKYLGFGARVFGINLEWKSRLDNYGFTSVYFRHHPYDEFSQTSYRFAFFRPVAIQVSANYLKYGHQTYGINLVWSQTGVEDWEVHVREGASAGQVVPLGSVVALYNRTARDYVVYCERPVGINLRWLKDCPSRYPQASGGSGSMDSSDRNRRQK